LIAILTSAVERETPNPVTFKVKQHGHGMLQFLLTINESGVFPCYSRGIYPGSLVVLHPSAESIAAIGGIETPCYRAGIC
jgi:hypothetical protein